MKTKYALSLQTTLVAILFLIASSFSLRPVITAVTGEELYRKSCKRCHGADGTRGWLGAKNLQESHLTTAAIIRQIEEGKGWMPSFKKKFNAEELSILAEYVKSLRQH